ncbi:hypothetical protein GF312_11740 [Candidatus Poribacteria bacterium]|nr:hypothetical protein [Candidatus Poribacteria bacterium]
MNLKLIVSLAILAVLGFLFYPRDEQAVPTEWIEIKNTSKGETLQGAKLRKYNPVVETYNLGYVYRINAAEISFGGEPKNYDILTSPGGNNPQYYRVKSSSASSSQQLVTFQPVEARYVRLVINDWTRSRPKINSTKIGAYYNKDTRVSSLRTSYNAFDAGKLVDGLKHQGAEKWLGAKRVEKKVEEDNKEVKKIVYESPGNDNVDVIFDLGIEKNIYGVSVTTGDGENNLKQYSISSSMDGRSFQQVFISEVLENKMVTDTHIFSDRIQARYIRLNIKPEGWYGSYPEIREVEIYTQDYRSSDYQMPIEEYNAIQVYYDNCGMDGNAQAPDVIQGFPFDRGQEIDPAQRYFFKPDEEVDGKNSPRERSFCYHYDRIIIEYTNLEPEYIYWVQVTYLQEKDGNRIQNLVADGIILHESMEIPKNVAQKLTYAVPAEIYADGKMELHFNRLAGPNAVVSEVAIFQASKQKALVEAEAQLPETVGRATQVAETVVVDGLLKEWPLIFPIVPSEFKDNPANSPCKMYVQWDADNLYVALTCNRSKFPELSKSSSFMESTDTLHLFVDAALTRSPGMYRTGDHHFRFLPLGTPDSERRILATQIHHHLDAIPRTIEDNRNIESAATLMSGNSGYTLETRIPKGNALYEYNPQPGSVIGFNFVLNNTYTERLFWSAEQIGASPDSWGKLELVGTVTAKTAVMNSELNKKLDSFNAGEILAMAVWDPDRNTDRNTPQSIKISVSGDITSDSIEMVLQETTRASKAEDVENNSDLFASKIKTQYGLAPDENDDILTVQGDEIITLSYVDPYYGPSKDNVEVKAQAQVRTGTTGVLKVHWEDGSEVTNFSAGDKLFFTVEDKDLIQKKKEVKEGEETPPPQINISIKSTKETEEVTLTDPEYSGIFTGSVETVYGTQAVDDGKLQLEGADKVIVSYVDSIQETGNTNVEIKKELTVNVGSTGRLIVGKSERGSVEDFTPVKDFNAGDDLLIFLTDRDIKEETTQVKVRGGSVLDTLTLTLKETEAGSDTFSGVLKTSYRLSADPNNNLLEVKGNENVTVTYNDELQASGATNVPVSETVVVNTGKNGSINILQANYFWDMENFNAGDTIYFKVEDGDLNTDPEEVNYTEISVVSEQKRDEERVLLEEKNTNSPEFFGSLETEYYAGSKENPEEYRLNDILQVGGNEKVTAIYIDRLRVTGETGVPITDSCESNVGTTGKIVVYSKNDPANPIAGFPDEGYNNRFKAGDTLVIRLEDMDLNIANAAAEIFQVSTTEDVIRDRVPVTLKEVSGSAGVFVGEVNTEYGTEAVPGDGILQVQGEGEVSISYVDSIRDTGETNVRIEAVLIVETGSIGTIEIFSEDGYRNISSFNAGESFIIRVRDSDLNKDPQAIDRTEATARGNILQDELEVILQETDLNSGIFEGSVKTTYGNMQDPYDDQLQVKEKEVVTITYIDEVRVTGETDIPVTVDLIVRSGVAGSLLIVDETYQELPNFNAGRKIYFRLDDFVLSNTAPNIPARIMVQSDGTNDVEEVLLVELPTEQGIYIGSISTTYGTTPSQDEVLQVRGGEEVRAIYYPQTPGSPSDPVIDTTFTNTGFTAKLTITGDNGLEITNFNAGDVLYFRLEDVDLNKDMFGIDTVNIWVVGDAIAGGKNVMLTETGENSNVFTGSIKTRYGRGLDSANVLEVVGGETVTAVYYDALTNSGETGVKISDSCRSNMQGVATYASEGVVIDGNLGEWPLENALRAGDEGSNIYVQWDMDNLYILAYIMDAEVVVPDPTRFWHGADALEIHIDTEPAAEVSLYLQGLKKPSTYFFWICPKGAGPDGNLPYVGQNLPETVYNFTEINTAVRILPGSRYVLEAKIPFDTALGDFDPYKTSKADRVGFNYIIRRSNASQLRWAAGGESDPRLSPSFFGTLILRQPNN